MRIRNPVLALPALLLALAAPSLHAQQDSLRPQQDSIVAPQLINMREVSRTLDDAYPPALRDARIGGLALMRVFVTADGKADTIRIAASTGLRSLDVAGYTTAKAARFRAGTHNGQPVGAWIDLNLEFRAEDSRRPAQLIPLPRRDEITTALQGRYPLDLRRSGVGTNIGFSVLVDAAGSVVQHDMVDPSCFASANEAASSFIASMVFDTARSVEPAGRRTLATVTFSMDTARLLLFGDTIKRDTTRTIDSAARTSTGGTSRAPDLRNRNSVAQALVRHYPPQLRRHGIGGTTNVHFRVETDGRVTHKLITATSGYCELDIAAVNVAKVMRFEPALLDGEPVPVWVEVPIIFNSRGR